MADVIPFQAVRPTRDKVGLVATRSYSVYTKAQIKNRLEENPYSFLHILNPGFKYGLEVEGLYRFRLVNNRYREFKENKIFVQDPKPCFYIYRQVLNDRDFVGIVAGTSIHDYRSGIIEIHEQTISRREELFKNYLRLAGFNSEPVLMTYKDHPGIDEVIAKYTSQRAEYEFATKNRYQHYVWQVCDEEDMAVIQKAFAETDRLYIADGHHRTASSVLLGEQINKESSDLQGPHNYFMSYLIAESKLHISEFNRLVKDLNGMSKEEFLMRLDEHFRIENRGENIYKPSKVHHYSMYLDGEYYALYLRKDEFSTSQAVQDLDPYILNELVLKPILGIEDPKTDKRLHYLSGDSGELAMKEKVDSDKFAVAFGLYPVSIEQVKKVADAGEIMPPKSTYIEPKLRVGLLVYEIL